MDPRAGLDGRKDLVPTGIRSQTIQPVVQSLYRLNYAAHKKVNQSHYIPEVPRGFQEVKVPRLRDNGPGWW